MPARMVRIPREHYSLLSLAPLRGKPDPPGLGVLRQDEAQTSMLYFVPSEGRQMRLLPVCFVIFAAHQVQAQQGGPQHTTGAGLTRSSFTANGLANEKLLTNFYLGDFVDIDLDRSDVLFLSLYNEYLKAFGRRCDAFLPSNKVEIKETVCAQQQYTVDRYGNNVGTGNCAAYSTVGTGIYADPTLYAAQEQLSNEVGVDTIRQVFRTMSGKNPLGAALNTLGAAQTIANDTSALVRVNACNSPGLKRFQENLMLFALGKPPVRLEGGGTAPAASRPSPETLSKNQNFTKLLEDLVLDQSRTWVMNRFVSGSVSHVVVSSRDAEGRPAKVTGSYLYNGQSRGSVTIGFSGGLPECMYFFDFPSTCRTPNRRVVAAYATGAYGQ